eukprot:7984923-Alexandrium_andersonii.AAC.1
MGGGERPSPAAAYKGHRRSGRARSLNCVAGPSLNRDPQRSAIFQSSSSRSWGSACTYPLPGALLVVAIGLRVRNGAECP